VRIAISTGTFHPESGGPPTYLHRLGAELVARGQSLRLVTFGEPTCHRYPHPVTRVSRRLPVPLRLAAYTAQLARLAAWADLLFVSDYGLPATLLRAFVDRPLVLKVVGDFAWESAVRRGLIPSSVTIDDFQRQPKAGRVAALDRLQRLYATRADRVIVPSDYLAGLVRGWGARDERIRVIHNAVDAARFDLLDSRENARRRLGLPNAAIVLTVARLTPWKGVDRVIRALTALPDLHLVHCGEGPEEARLRRLAVELGVADRVHFRGLVARDEIPRYMRAADLFVLYSGYEGLPHVVLEAFAARRPVVVSDRGGNVEVVKHEHTGLVVPWDRPEQLTVAVGRLLDEPTLRDRLTASAHAYVESAFGWPRLVDQTLAVFEEARAEHGRRSTESSAPFAEAR
jgi:glycosyltransferase involved in cell wall biosynthesis